MIYRHQLTVTVTSEVDDDYPDPESIFRDVSDEMINCSRATHDRLRRVVPGANIEVVWTAQRVCPAMHCPLYREEHYMGADGCLYDEEGDEHGQ